MAEKDEKNTLKNEGNNPISAGRRRKKTVEPDVVVEKPAKSTDAPKVKEDSSAKKVVSKEKLDAEIKKSATAAEKKIKDAEAKKVADKTATKKSEDKKEEKAKVTEKSSEPKKEPKPTPRKSAASEKTTTEKSETSKDDKTSLKDEKEKSSSKTKTTAKSSTTKKETEAKPTDKKKKPPTASTAISTATPKIIGKVNLDELNAERKKKTTTIKRGKETEKRPYVRKKPTPTASSQNAGTGEIDINFGEVPQSGKRDLGKKDRKSLNNDRFETRASAGFRSRKKNLSARDLEKDEFRKNKYKKKSTAKKEIVLDAGEVLINIPITVGGLASQILRTSSQIIAYLWSLNIPATINSELDEDSVLLIADELDVKVKIGKNETKEADKLLDEVEEKEDPKKLKPRAPIVTIMGHVDHGKTSLLDAIRDTNVTDKESGGITQHIGASEIKVNDKKIVFLDTPGHEAFSQMRARGASVTDIAVLVVAADDGVKPQTIESINHAKAAGVPIIVAINKIDKEGANPEVAKKELSENNLLVEEWGGDVPLVLVSAKTKKGIDDLLELILLQAEILELKANPDKLAKGIIIESRLDAKKGVVATVLVLEGTLKFGDSVVAGVSFGKVRSMKNDKGKTIKKAAPATATEILGLDIAPEAGDKLVAVADDKTAREIASSKKTNMRIESMTRKAGLSLEGLFDSKSEAEGSKQLNLIIKTDVSGSLTPINDSLLKLSNDKVKINIVHSGVGAISDSDISLAITAGAIVIGFHVRPSLSAEKEAENNGIEIRTYKIIYDITDDIKKAMEGMLDPEFKEKILGRVEIREIFKVSGIGVIGGAFVIDGEIRRNASVRLLREGTIIHEGEISSLKRFKDDVKEVKTGFECGIGLSDYDDMKVGDEVECFIMEEVKK